jgi:hypothetical protein
MIKLLINEFAHQKTTLCFFDENDTDHKTNLGNKPINQYIWILLHRSFV